MKLNRLIIPLLVLSLAGTNGYSQAASGAGAGGTGATGAGAAAGAGAAGASAVGGITAGALAVGVAAAAAVGVAVAIASNNNSSGRGITNVCSVTINKDTTTIAALSGDITYYDKSGSETKIDIGTGLIIDENGDKTTKSLTAIIADEKANGTYGKENSVSAGLTKALTTVAGDTATYGEDTGAVMAAIIKTTVKADPSFAAEFTKISITAIAQDKTLTAEQKQAAVAAVAEASLAGATDRSEVAAQVTVIQNILRENAENLAMDASEISALVLDSRAAANGDTGKSNVITPPTSTYDIDLVSPSST
jgi:hypothetical protein